MFTSTSLLDELEQLFKGVAMMKELTHRTRDYLVSFFSTNTLFPSVNACTRIFAAYLNKLWKKARQVCQIFDCVLQYMFYLFLLVFELKLQILVKQSILIWQEKCVNATSQQFGRSAKSWIVPEHRVCPPSTLSNLTQ